MYDYSTFDAVTVVLSPHGDAGGHLGYVLGAHGLRVGGIDVLHEALGCNRTLKGMAKLIFMQACPGRGPGRAGTRACSGKEGEADAAVAGGGGRATLHSDFVIAYASPPGTMAWRGGGGSLFLRARAREYDGSLLHAALQQQAIQYIVKVASAVHEAMEGGRANSGSPCRDSYRVHLATGVSSCVS